MRTLNLCCRIALFTLLLFTLTVSVPISLADEVAQPDGKGAAPRILIAYYSLTGNTEKMARGVAEGIGHVPATWP